MYGHLELEGVPEVPQTLHQGQVPWYKVPRTHRWNSQRQWAEVEKRAGASSSSVSFSLKTIQNKDAVSHNIVRKTDQKSIYNPILFTFFF